MRACVCVCAWVRGEWNLHCTGTTLCPIVLDLRRDALYSDVAPSIGVTIILQCHVVLLFGAFIINNIVVYSTGICVPAIVYTLHVVDKFNTSRMKEILFMRIRLLCM